WLTNKDFNLCLPLVSEGLKLVWTQSDQTRELDGIPELVQAFNIFPYPTSQEVTTLARVCALPLDKVKVWFMVQRIKYGISWASEDIEETRLKLARPEQMSETEHKESSRKRKNGTEDLKETEDHVEDLVQSPQVTSKALSCSLTFPFISPTTQDSYYYRQPVEIPEKPQAATPPTSTESPVGSRCCLTPPEPAAPTSSSSSPSITPSKKHSGRSSKSARFVKANALNNSLNPSDNTSPSSVLTAAGRPRKTKEQLAVLKEYFQRCPWPKSDVYTQIVEQTSLPRADVIQWFGDTRYAVKNGHVRWVHADIRDQVLAEIALLQSGGAAADATGTPGSEGNRKRKSQGISTPKTQKSAMDSVDLSPLEQYYRQMGPLQEKDLDNLCRKSKMSYQQVRDWFASKDSTTLDTEITVID
uniref:Homeobox and leucine zipper encoding a n=1 Tax=Cyprinus carpio TaxID=7962 RepID=A0A8C2HGW0_CYPCA